MEGLFLSPHKCFWRFGTCEASLNIVGCVTLQTSNGGVLIQWSRSSLQYLGGITSPSFSVPTIKTSKRHFFLFSSQFIISENSPLYFPYSSLFIISSQKRLQRSSRDTKITLHPTLRKFCSSNFIYLLR